MWAFVTTKYNQLTWLRWKAKLGGFMVYTMTLAQIFSSNQYGCYKFHWERLDMSTGSGVAWESLHSKHLLHYLSVSVERMKASSRSSMAGQLFLTHYSFYCIINCPWSCSQWPQRWVLRYVSLNAYCILAPATAKELLEGLCFVPDGHLHIYYNMLGLEVKTLIFVGGLKQTSQREQA